MRRFNFRSFIDAVQRGLAPRLPPGASTDIYIKCTQRPTDDAGYVQAHVDAIITQHSRATATRLPMTWAT